MKTVNTMTHTLHIQLLDHNELPHNNITPLLLQNVILCMNLTLTLSLVELCVSLFLPLQDVLLNLVTPIYCGEAEELGDHQLKEGEEDGEEGEGPESWPGTSKADFL